MGATSHTLIAAGFVEVTDSPSMLLTALAVGFAYLAMLAVPASYLLRRLEGKKWRREVALGICLTAVAPFLFRGVAMVVQGRGWGDRHFIWLYLLGAVLVACVYYLAIIVWIAFGKGNRANKRPDGTSAKALPSKPSQGAAVPHP